MQRLALLALALAAPAPLLAETAEDGPGELIIVTGERERGYRSETASGVLFGERSLLETPFQVSVFPIELLQDQQVRTLFDVSKNDASVVATDAATGFYDSIAIRGFELSNSSGYYRDGLLYQNQAQSPFENKAAVEIVKGLTGLRFGYTAPGGIVNYVLKRPTSGPYRFAEAFGDGNGGIGVHVDLGGPLTETLAVRFNAVVSREALFVDGISGPRHMASLALRWTPSDRLAIDLEGEYQFRELEQNATISLDSFVPEASEADIRAALARYDRRTFLGQPWTTYPTRNFVGSARLRFEASDALTLRAAVQKMHLNRDQNAIYIGFQSLEPNGDFDAELYYQPDQTRSPLNLDLAIDARFGTGPIAHELTAGLQYLDNPSTFPFFGVIEVLAGSNIFAPVAIPNPNRISDPSYTAIRQQQWSFYVTDYVRLTERLELLLGLRHTRPKFETFFNADLSRDSLYEEAQWTPTAGLLFRPSRTVTLYASYAEGFEPGGQAPLGTENQNQVLPPITSRQWEAGVRAELFQGATASAALFSIERPLELIDDRNRFMQDGLQRHRGFEASLAGEVVPSLRLVAGLQYLDARIVRTADAAIAGNRPINVPEWQANFYADWTLPSAADLALNGGLFIADRRFADAANSFSVAGWARLDLGARLRFALGGAAEATARVIVENVFDGNYFTGTPYGTFQYAAPRTVRLALSGRF
jgi:iron complex outermembrane receptor protein